MPSPSTNAKAAMIAQVQVLLSLLRLHIVALVYLKCQLELESE